MIHVESGPVLAVVPSNHRIDLTRCRSCSTAGSGSPARPARRAFDDCDIGAAPPVGSAYDVPTVIDRSLTGLDRVWFEGGDHRTLVTIAGADFDRLMRDARQGGFSHAV